jgi:hypothetical protein
MLVVSISHLPLFFRDIVNLKHRKGVMVCDTNRITVHAARTLAARYDRERTKVLSLRWAKVSDRALESRERKIQEEVKK